MRRISAALAVALTCLLAPALADATPQIVSSVGSCPVGSSAMGCSLPPVFKGVSVPPPGEIVPDVSSYQGVVDWPAVAAWQRSHGWKVTGGIFKLGENVIDPYAVANAAGLRAAGMVAIGYVFVRPGVQASAIIGWAKAAGIKVVVLDEEVSGIQGTAARITPALEAAGLTVVDYHSQGNVLDTTAQGFPCWTADYGPSVRPDCTTGKTVAWQFTDLGSIPGITGLVDESITYGLLRLADPAKPKPSVTCPARVRSIAKACLKLFPNQRFGVDKINERNAVSTYKYHRKRSIHAHIVYLRNRVWFVAHFKVVKGRKVRRQKPDWSFHRGYRYQRLARDAAGR